MSLQLRKSSLQKGQWHVPAEAEPVGRNNPWSCSLTMTKGRSPGELQHLYRLVDGWLGLRSAFCAFSRSIPIPNLATDAVQSEDGLTWEITLRDDVTWHDGEPFNVEDVIFSYQFLMDSARAPALNVIESMEANGDYGLTLNLSSPSPFFLNEGLAGYYIMPEHIWRDVDPISDELNQFREQLVPDPSNYWKSLRRILHA